MFESPAMTATAPGAAGWQSPAEVLLGHVDGAGFAVTEAGGVAEGTAHALSTGELSTALAGVDNVHARTEALTVRLVAEGLGRGLHTETALSPRDWVTTRCPWLSPHMAGDIVAVAHAAHEMVHAPVVEAVTTMALSVRRAAAVLRALDRVKPILEAPEYDQAMALLLDTAGASKFTDRDLKRATDFLISVVLPEKDHEARAQGAREMRGVHESSLADGSCVRFIVTCDAEGAAVFRAVMASTLAAPQPTSPDAGPEAASAVAASAAPSTNSAAEVEDDDAGSGEAGKDTRTATQRRHDALMTVLRRGLAGGEDMPTTPKAAVQVTIRWDVLRAELTGLGTTATGEVLSPETVRRLACDADLIPIVLGTDNEILAMGRARRLVTPGQRRVLEYRDRHCSFPGCSIPASWCDAHHVVHWSRNGPSDVDNYALLCGRHHTVVHDRDLTATVTASGVRWHV